MCRRSNLDWEDPALISKLCSIYLGTLVNKNAPASAQPVAKELRRQPVGTRIRLKLLPYLSRSKTAATLFPQSVQVPTAAGSSRGGVVRDTLISDGAVSDRLGVPESVQVPTPVREVRVMQAEGTEGQWT